MSASLADTWRDVPVGTNVVVTREDGTTFRTRTTSTPYLIYNRAIDGLHVDVDDVGTYPLERVAIVDICDDRSADYAIIATEMFADPRIADAYGRAVTGLLTEGHRAAVKSVVEQRFIAITGREPMTGERVRVNVELLALARQARGAL